jgi:PilZ domain-containing protein
MSAAARPSSARSRRGFAHEGFVRFNEETYPCQVTDMSATGAILTFKLLIELPPRFTVQLTREGMVTRTCVVTWQEDYQVGVLFEPNGVTR